MLIPVKYNETTKIDKIIKMNALFLKEVYGKILPQEIIDELLKFNIQKVISSEIKEKSYTYYLIDDIGFLCLKENLISKIFIYKSFRKQEFAFKTINYLKESIKNLRITIPENSKKLLSIVERWGFKKSGNIARYIGNDTYIYENVFV